MTTHLLRAPSTTARRRAGVCEPDDALRAVVPRALAQAAFATVAAATGAEALERFGPAAPPLDVVILAAELPDADGRAVCRELRSRGVFAPVLLVSSDPGDTARRAALGAGADDHLAKPYALAELLVRIGGLVGPAAGAGPFHAGRDRARLDPDTRSITAANGRVDLTPTEFRLLAALAERRGGLVDRGALLAAGWPEGAVVSDNTLDAFVARLRRKLRAAGATDAVHTRRGVGYELR
jgi:two-component system OmpR family response regulator